MSDLIDKLRTLNPTPGEWEFDDAIFAKDGKDYECVAGGYALDDDDWRDDGLIEINNPDDATLIEAAPSMRLELLRMADELTALRNERDNLKQAVDAFCAVAVDGALTDTDARRETVRIAYGLHGIEG